MDKEVVAGLITLSSVVLGAVVSLIASGWATRREIRARNRDLFGSTLIQKRFEHYPELYRAMSSFHKVLKDIPQGAIASFSNDHLQKFSDYVLDWDSKYSYLMSEKCKNQWANYYWRFDRFSAVDLVKDQELRQRIVIMTMGIESSLKSDLGIYTMESSDLDIFLSNYPGVESPDGMSGIERAYWKLTDRLPWAVRLNRKLFSTWEPFKKLVNGEPSKKLIK